MIDFKKKIEEKEKKELRNNPNNQISSFNNKKRRRKANYIITAIVIILVLFGKIIISETDSINWLSPDSFFGKISHLISSSDKELPGEKNDRINILLLGMGGEGHDGAYLTDTILLASIQPSTGNIALISIPRDLAGPINNSSVWEKINHINAYAEVNHPGTEGKVTAKKISDLLQIPIPYYVLVDFSGFIDIINEVGGITVNVKNSFDDYKYPIKGEEKNSDYYSRFEHLHINAGKQKMNGELALKYARSRHALGAEGSDFARAKRQQIILEAVKEKLLSKQTLLNPIVLRKLIAKLNNNVSTNLKAWEMLKVWEMIKHTTHDNIINKVLNDAPNNYLVASTGQNGAFLLVPKTGNFSEIRKMIKNVLNNTKVKPKEIEPVGEGTNIVIINGTWVGGLAKKTEDNLEQYKYNVVKIDNAPTRDYSESIIYDLTYGHKDKALHSLIDLNSAKQAFNAPEWIKKYEKNNNVDFILILGKLK